MSHDPQEKLTPAERHEVEERATPRAPVIHAVVYRHGEEELRRPASSLLWSGVAAGVTMMSSVIAEAALLHKIPAGVPGREAIADLGYSIGFIMVVLGRLQLFTEQTVVAVLPVMARPGRAQFAATARLWVIVFLANMIGAAAAAAINLHLNLVSPALAAAMLDVSETLLARTPLETLQQAIPAGFIVASMAWIRAGSGRDEFLIVFALAYAIALGDFTHVVAGAAEAFLLLFDGRIDLAQALGGLILPALVGNIIGGTGLLALLAHAQVREEL
jgi:formate/nitrite transporter FocA (FNT family)